MILAQTDLSLPIAAAAAAGITAGWLITFLVARGKQAALKQRIKSELARANEQDVMLSQLRAETKELNQLLAKAQSSLEYEMKAAAEKQALLDRAEEKLTHTFKALSSEALKASSEQFLQLAKSSLATQTEQAKGEIEKRKTAIENLVKPVSETLGKFEIRIGEIEKIREGAYAELKEQVRALGEGQIGLQRETASLVRALRQPTGRGQWGEMQLKRVVELAGMQEHCDFETQHSSTDDEGIPTAPSIPKS